MKSEITIRNSADVCRIDIEGTIGVPEEWQFEQPASRVATYEKFRDTVERIAAVESPEIVVDIRSTGGDVNDALLIYEALKGLGAHITTRCFGYTASAATVIAQAASEGCRLISPNALYLIHDSSCAAEGNASELEARAELLHKTDERLAALYAERSGREAGHFAALMSENGGEGRWLSPDEVLEAGLADALVSDAQAEEPAGEPEKTTQSGMAMAIARNWSRLKSVLGGGSAAVPPAASEDRNILHFEGVGLSEREQRRQQEALAVAFREGQRSSTPSATKPVEDPSTGDVRRTANEQAYADDLRRLMQRNNC